MSKSAYQILKEANDIPVEKDRVLFLLDNKSTQLKTLLDYGFNRLLKFDIPEGIPPFKTEESDNSAGRLLFESKLLYRFLAPPRGIPGMKRSQKEKLFMDVLETVDKDDAILLCHIKDKTVDKLFNNINRRVVNKAFPTLIKEKE